MSTRGNDLRKIISIAFLVLSFNLVLGQELTKGQEKAVKNFIENIKYQKKTTLTATTHFPLNREYPLPQIKTTQDFLLRYNEVFDDSLNQIIVNSKPSKDWSAVGWRGIMLLDGLVWIDDKGNLIAVNYQSKYETKKQKELIQADKNMLHSSVNNFDRPVNILETKTYRIRIDDLGKGNYRYASWPLKSKMSDKPDIVITNGECKFDGSGGNHSFEFHNKEFTYECYINVLGPDNSPPASLTIYNGKKEILSQNAIVITR